MLKFSQLPGGSFSQTLLVAVMSLAAGVFAGLLALVVVFAITYRFALGDLGILLTFTVPLAVGIFTVVVAFRKFA